MAEQNNFWIDLVAALQKSKSKKQVQSDAKNLGDIYTPLIGKLNKTKTKAQIKQDLSTINGTVNLNAKINSKGVVQTVQQTAKQAQQKANSTPIQMSVNIKKDKLINDIKILAQQNSKMFKDVNMSSKYHTLLNNAQLATSSKEVQNLRMQLAAMRSELKANNLAGLTLGDTFKKTFRRATELFTGTGGVMLLSQQLRQAWNEALQLDKSYTGLIKVQNELSRSDYPEYLERCNKKAQDLATTQKALIESTEEFSKSGYNLSDSNALSEKATILSNVGEMTAPDSAKAIISGVQAYDIVDGYDDAVNKAGALIDKYNEIGNTASITTEEIAKGVQSVGSVFADANTSVDEFIALLAAGNRQFQDADSLALGLRTSALRIRGCTAELEEMGEETDGVITSTSKLEEKIKALTDIDGMGGLPGVEILEADGETFRSIYDIFVDIGEVYDKMSDTDQSALLELISGKHRASAISATLENTAEAQEIYKRSLEATGSAQEEYDKYLASSEASLNRFKASMTETYQSVINGETAKGILDTGNAVLQFANSIGLVESTLKGFIAIGIVKGITALSTAFKASAIQASNFGMALNTVKDMSTMAKGTTEYRNALGSLKTVASSLSATQLKQVLASKALSDADRVAILQTTGLTKAQAQAKLVQMGLTTSTKAQATANASATASTFSLTAAVKGFGASLKAAFMNNPIGIAIMVISTAIGAVSSAVSSHNQKMEEMREQAKQAADEANTLGDEVADLASKYIILSEAVKTDSSAKEDLMTTQTELLKKLGLEGKSIDSLIEKYGSLSNAIRQASIDSLKNSQLDLIAGVDATRDELLDVAKDNFWGSNNIISAAGDDAVKAFKELEKAGVIDSGSYGTGGGNLVLIGDETVDGALENYKRLEDALTALRDSEAFTAEELTNNTLYQSIYGRYSEMKEEVEAYNSSIDNLNENLAQQAMLTSLQGRSLPTTKEEFESFKNELIDAAIASEQFIGTEEDITNSILGYLASVPEFSNFYTQELETLATEAEKLTDKTPVSFEEILKNYPELEKMATVGKLDENVLSSTDKYADLLEAVGLSADSASGDLKKVVDRIQEIADNNWIDSMKSVSDDFESLGDTYNKLFNEKKTLNIEDLDNVQNVFGDLDVFDEWVAKATNAETSTKELQQAFDDMATEYLNKSEMFQTGLTGLEDFETLKNSLAELGVVNADIVAFETLISNTDALKEAGLNLVDATDEEIAKFVEEIGIIENVDQAIAILQFRKQSVSAENMDTSTEVTNLRTLAENAGYTGEVIQWLAELEKIYQEVASGTLTMEQMGNKLARADELQNLIKSASGKIKYKSEVDFDGSKATKSAGKAGKEAGDAYVEEYEKALKKLGDLKDQGKISEYEYLQECRKLYEKYFKDIEKYAENFAKAQADYLEGMKSLYESVFSHLTSQIDNRIDAINDEKDATVDSLNAQKEAAETAYQAQIDGIQAKIDALEEEKKANQKIIDGLQDEIDAINDAAKARQREIDLQKAQYNLERMMNQRTNFIYKQGEDGVPGQMVYEADTTGIRDARNDVEDAKDQIRIGELEKQIDYYEKLNDSIDETIEGYESQIDAIEKMVDQSNAYYDSLIAQTEKYYDSLTKALENQKSKFEELQELFDKAKMEQVLKELGIDEEALLNGSIEEFNKLRDGYLGVLKDMTNGNAGFQQALSDLSGVDMSNLTGHLEATADSLGKLGDTTANVDAVATSTEKLGASATTASEGMNTLKESTADISDDLSSIQTGISGIDSTGISATTEAFTLLADAIGKVASALGIGGEDTVGGLLTALEQISTFTLSGEEGTGIISQFESLATAVNTVSSAISGEGGGSTQGGEGSNSSSLSMSADATGVGSSVTSALDSLKEKADEVLGSGGGEGSGGEGEEGGSGVTGQFEALKGAVDDVSTAIGIGGEGSEEGGSSGEENASTLTGAIENLGKTATTVLTGGEDSESGGMISQFEELNVPLGEASGYVTDMKSALEEMNGKTFTVTLEVNGGIGGGTQSFIASYGAKADGTAHIDIPAHVEGKWGASESSESLVGELGREGIVKFLRLYIVIYIEKFI